MNRSLLLLGMTALACSNSGSSATSDAGEQEPPPGMDGTGASSMSDGGEGPSRGDGGSGDGSSSGGERSSSGGSDAGGMSSGGQAEPMGGATAGGTSSGGASSGGASSGGASSGGMSGGCEACGAQQVCENASCVCENDYGDCDGRAETGCEQSLLKEFHCGACDHDCFVETRNATGILCDSGVCNYSACEYPYDDCDLNRENGCEISLAKDPDNCGECGKSCAPNEHCHNGACDEYEQIVAGLDFTCVRRKSGTIACWGSNEHGILGDEGFLGQGLLQAATSPVHDGAFWTHLTAFPTRAALCGVSGDTFCWGDNTPVFRQGANYIGSLVTRRVCGTSPECQNITAPTTLDNSLNYVSVDLGHTTGLLLDTAGDVYWFGKQPWRNTPNVPTKEDSFSGIDGIAAGGDFGCGLDVDGLGLMFCQGYNSRGQLCTNSTTNHRFSAVQSSGILFDGTLELGDLHGCSVNSGLFGCWGDNQNGEIGQVQWLPTPIRLGPGFSTSTSKAMGSARVLLV